MNHRRYDEIVSLIASITLGLLAQDFYKRGNALAELIDGKTNPSTSSLWLGYAAFIGSLLVGYRGIHGLIAYDRWVEVHKYSPPFEFSAYDAVRQFIVAILAVLIGPYLPFLLIDVKKESLALWITNEIIFVSFFIPFFIYFYWNVFWIRRLTAVPPAIPRTANDKRAPDDSAYLAYDELVRFTRKWVRLDLFWITITATGLLAYACFANRKIGAIASDPSVLFIFYVFWALLLPCVDLLWNVDFYFASKRPPELDVSRGEHDLASYPDIWDKVLPDGKDHCHWGGVKESAAIVSLLQLTPTDALIDFCCGCGGVSRLAAQKCGRVAGFDVSARAIDYCDQKKESDAVEFYYKCDATEILIENPHMAGSFDKAVAIDADAWLHPDKLALLKIVNRSLRRGGIFIFQSYMSSNATPFYIKRRTKAILQSMGYPHAETLDIENIDDLWTAGGFKILSNRSKHEVYQKDNLTMIDRLKKGKDELCSIGGGDQYSKVRALLKWERELFKRGAWTGRVIVASAERCV